MLSLSIYDELQLRIGTPEDLDEVMQLAIEAAKENSLVPANPELLLRAVWPALHQNHGIVGCIGKPGGAIEGMVVLQIGTLFYSDSQCVEEKVVYVRHDYRAAQGGRARKLCEFSKSIADGLCLPLIIGVFSSEMTKQKVGLYRRIFGEPAGSYWVYGGKTGGHPVT